MGLARIKVDDDVIVIRGKDRGKRGRVLRVLKTKERVVVEGINIVIRHLRRNPQNPQAGGRQERPAPIHASNVMPWSDDGSKGVRVRAKGTGQDKHRVTPSGKTLAPAGRSKAGRAVKKKTKQQEKGE